MATKKKTIRAMNAPSVETFHFRWWKLCAAVAGWAERDIESLDSILRLAKDEQRVVEITKAAVHMLSLGTYELEGKDKNGNTVKSSIPYEKRWTWNFYAQPESRIEPRSTNQKWCPAHGTACDPSLDGCGIRDVVSLELCHCKRYHVRECEVGRWIAEARVDAEMREAERRNAPQRPAEPAPAYVPPKTKRMRPTKANGWFLPGQTAMVLPSTQTNVVSESAGKPKSR